MRILILAFTLVMITACVTGYNPRYRFNEVQVVNLAGATLENVSWRVLDTDRSLSCDEVAKFAVCGDYFPGRNYPQSGVEVSWTHSDGELKSEILSPPIPVTYSNSFALRIVIEISADGSVNAFYEQDEPGRDGGMFTVN